MIPNYVSDKGKLYEIDEKGERTLVRSTDSEKRAYLRFTNKTTRDVTVWWRDFRGVRHEYLCLGPRKFADVNTYITHPWEFTDESTKENLVINNSIIFRPPESLGNMQHRSNWNITVTVRSLKFAAMLVIADRIRSLAGVERLGLPVTLKEDVMNMVQDIIKESRVVSEIKKS